MRRAFYIKSFIQFLRHENYHRGPGNRKTDARRVSGVYDALTGRIVARRDQKQEVESGSGQRTHIDDGDRSYRNVKKAESEARRRVEGFWACPICGRRVGQPRGTCLACNLTGKMKWDSGNDKNKTSGSGHGVSGNSFHRDRTYGSGNKYSNGRAMGGTSKERLRNGTSELLVSDNVQCSSIPKQATEADALSISIKQEAELNSGGEPQIGMLSFDDLSRDMTCESSRDSVGNRSSRFEVSDNVGQSSLPEQVSDVHPLPSTMKQGSESASGGEETLNDLSTSGNTINDLDQDEICLSVNKTNLVGSASNRLNCIDRVKDLSEGNAVVVENGWLAHGFTTEDVARNETNGLEVSENSASSPTNQVQEDFSGERVVGTIENECSTHCSGKEFICDGLVENESSEVKVSENAEQSWFPVGHNRESDKTGLSSCNDGMNDQDRDGTEVSIKKVDLVGKSARQSGLVNGVKDFSRERTLTVLENGYGQGFNVGDVVTKKKKGKRVWVCSNCGHAEGQWWGECKVCKCVGTIKRFSVGDSGGSGDETMVPGNSVRSWIRSRPDEALPLRLTDVNRGINKLEWRITMPGSLGSEVARVLGGGLVPGSLVLVGGDPGVGKSTLLLQIAAIIAEGNDIREPGPVVYVSGEESVEQIGSRADRLDIGTKELFLYSSTDIEDILGKAHLLSPRLLIVDSIQTVYLQNVTGSAGGISQVKECTSALLRYAKSTNVPVLLIGHVTKTGDIAGPRVLEHIVDVVLYLEGEKCTSHRLLRSVKNRFGSTDELGVFEMSQSGLQIVSNPSEMYLTEQHSDSDFLAGLAVAVIMDGARTFLIEIQALCSSGSKTSRHFNGIQSSRADMIISVLAKQAGLKLQEGDIFLNVVSGVKLLETAGDLAIAAAICSSFLEFPIPSGVAFIGEIGLSGELRGVPRMDLRLNTVAKLGYKKCIVPKSSVKSLKGIDHKELEIIGCSNLKQVINTVFTNL